MVLGRSSSCDLVIDDNTVSRQHARIWIDDQSRVLIEDMGSSNGTWCLEQRLGRAALGSRASVRLGDVGVLFEVERRMT